ncbi:oxidoreductase [Staphylococcus capitis]|uniref:NAD(P)-binding oxidoreductase n=2 Tax=Staphylococcus TaxID=1279 RepID=UPI000D1BAFCF|nr:NAD(P)-binding oxidoreductase [Staphylococcus capitis]PTH09405.1 oxidoreductase [Staphylococcus capitis]
MSILLIGANGGVGSRLVQQLKSDNIDFTAGVRKEEQVKELKDQDVDATLVDVEKATVKDLTQLFNNYDKVIFSVGSGGSTGDDKTIIVDLDGAVKTIEASKEADIKHYVMVSTYDSRREAFDSAGDLKPYTIAKHYSDDYLRNSGGLNYTIVHPGRLTDDEGTGKIEADLYFDKRASIPREDVATVLKEVVTSDKFANQEFQILSGDKEIKDALQKYE